MTAADVVVCTAVDSGHLPDAMAWQRSVRRHGVASAVALVVDLPTGAPRLVDGLELVGIENLRHRDGDSAVAHRTRCAAWAEADGADVLDLLRWSSKPVLIETLLERWPKVLFFDADITVVADWTFLAEALDEAGVLLTPHRRCLRPHGSCRLWEDALVGGLYNAGFLGFSQLGAEALRWWRSACRGYVGRRPPHWDDQRYLDVLAAEFPGVRVLTHLGCNVATWNRHRIPRTRRDGHVYAGDDPVVFVHWSNFNWGDDPTLRRWFLEWEDEVAACRAALAASS